MLENDYLWNVVVMIRRDWLLILGVLVLLFALLFTTVWLALPKRRLWWQVLIAGMSLSIAALCGASLLKTRYAFATLCGENDHIAADTFQQIKSQLRITQIDRVLRNSNESPNLRFYCALMYAERCNIDVIETLSEAPALKRPQFMQTTEVNSMASQTAFPVSCVEFCRRVKSKLIE